MAVAAKCPSHAKQAGNNILAQEDCRQKRAALRFFFVLKAKVRMFVAFLSIPLS